MNYTVLLFIYLFENVLVTLMNYMIPLFIYLFENILVTLYELVNNIGNLYILDMNWLP